MDVKKNADYSDLSNRLNNFTLCWSGKCWSAPACKVNPFLLNQYLVRRSWGKNLEKWICDFEAGGNEISGLFREGRAPAPLPTKRRTNLRKLHGYTAECLVVSFFVSSKEIEKHLCCEVAVGKTKWENFIN